MADSAEKQTLWLFDASLAMAVIGSVLYGISFLWITSLTMVKYRAWFFTCVPFGAAMEVAGYVLRCYSIKNPLHLPSFVITLVFIALAPIFVAAGNYLLIGRLIRSILPPSHHRIFYIPARWLTWIFVCCDIASLTVQSNASGELSKDNFNGGPGVYMMIGGLSLQVLTFACYLVILRRFHYLANIVAVESAGTGWRKVLIGIYVSSGLIMLRCLYRVAEFAEGVHGYAYLHEWLFWVFESLPMLIAITIFCFYFPSKYLTDNGAKSRYGDEEATSTELPQVAGRK